MAYIIKMIESENVWEGFDWVEEGNLEIRDS